MAAMWRIGAALVCATVALTGLASPAVAKHRHTIHVRPKPNGISKAIDRAAPGDRVVLKRGRRYHEDVVIDKRIRLVGQRKGKLPTVDGGCDTRFTIAVRAEGVKLKRLRVVGADEGFGSTPSEVDFTRISNGTAEQLRLKDTCDAEYGLNVLDSGPLKFHDNRISGFEDAGVYIGSIDDTEGGQLLVEGTEAFHNQIGVLVEFSGGGDIRVTNSRTHDNNTSTWTAPAGIVVFASDGVTLQNNLSEDNGVFGFHLKRDGMYTADNNRFFGNVAVGNPQAYVNEGGGGNCGSGNSPSFVPAC
jgi:parallel beta-helix repeat protein